MDQRPAGDLEPLGAELAEPSDPLSPLTDTMRVGLIAATALCVVGALTQLLATIWVLSLTAIVAGAGTILVHTGGLEPRTFATCSVLALASTAALLLGIVVVWVHKRARGAFSKHDDPLYVRRPVLTTCLGLLLALCLVTAAGARPSPYFPYPLATIVVLTNAYFFAVFVVVAFAWATNAIWGDLARWAAQTRYRAGFLTAAFALLGVVGVVAGATKWYRHPLEDAEKELELEQVHGPTGFFDAELKGLCLAAGEVMPGLATSASAAPGCGFLPNSESREVRECLEKLQGRPLRELRDRLATTRLPKEDRADVVMNAAIATCTRRPPPDNLEGYLTRVAQNEAKRMRSRTRTVPCDDLDDFEAPRCELEDRLDDAKLQQVWESAMCSLDRRAAAIVRWRLREDETFDAIGQRFQITADAAKDAYHNAIKRLRKLGIGECFREDFQASP